MARRGGFTLIELLVVLGILAVVAGLTAGAVQKVRAAAAAAGCQNNMRQVGLALLAFHTAKHRFPPGYVTESETKADDAPPGWGWAAFVLPQLDQQPLYSRIAFDQAVWDARYREVVLTRVPVLLCPADGPPDRIPVGPRLRDGAMRMVAAELAPASYVGSYGVAEPGIDGDGLLYRNSRITLADIRDGASVTFLGGERCWAVSETVWAGVVAGCGFVPTPGSPAPFQIDDAANFVLGHTGEMWDGAAVPAEVNSYSSRHPGGPNFLFADGHVKKLTAATDYTLLKALSTRAGGETISGEPN